MRLRRRDVNFLLLSALLHLSILATLLKRPIPQDTIEIELMSVGNADKGSVTDNSRILEKIPAKEVKKEKPKKGFWGIGIEIDPFYHATATDRGILNGWYITHVPSGYPADDLGLQRGDIIVTVNGEPLSNFNDVRGTGPDRVTFEVYRNGRIISFTVNRAFINQD